VHSECMTGHILGSRRRDCGEALRRHILAVPSSREGFGIVCLEAVDAGLPVLALSAGGAFKGVTDGGTGYLIALGDVAAPADRLGVVRRGRKLSARLGLAARRRALDRPR
jgi:glycosyltransferase involved in cell wall biosynthesis